MIASLFGRTIPSKRCEMTRTISTPQKRLYLIGALLLALGLASAALIYANAEDNADIALGYEMVNGVAYPTASKDSKAFQRDVRLYGGKFALLSDEFTDWFGSLWRGRRLAFTVAALSVVLSAGLVFVANVLLSDPDSDVRPESSGDRSG
jgi:hypothetical protein